MSVKSAPKIAIVIVNYKTPHLVTDCLMSLREAALQGNISVFIGDAESDDGSVEIISDFIAREALTWAQCFAIGRNGGFAYGNNAIITRCVTPDPDFTHVFFLNPDTYVRQGAVEALVSFMQAHPDTGIVGSRVEEPDGTPSASGFRAPTPWREFFRGARLNVIERYFPGSVIHMDDLQEDTEVDWVSGASFMATRALLDDIGLMDDGFFLYFEETDLMLRARAAGYEVWHVAGSRVVHLEGQSTGGGNDAPSAGIKPLSPFWLASRRRYMCKHYGRFGPVAANICFLTGDLIYRAHRVLRGRSVENPPHMWRRYLNPKGADE